MTSYAMLLVGLALAGDGRPPDARKVYPVADLVIPALPVPADKVYPVGDLVVPAWRSKALEEIYLRAVQHLEKDYIPFPETDAERDRRYFERLLQLEKDHIPFPESDVILLPMWLPLDPVLGYYPPSKALVVKSLSKRK